MTARGPVGILGGMGPEATLLLMRRVLEAVPARNDSDHVPLLVDQNPQVPSRIAHLIDGQGADPAPVLAAMARRLAAAGAVALAMPCNTAHHYAEAIRGATGLRFLDMIGLSAEAARQAVGSDGRVGILGSPALRRTGLFDKALAPWDLQAVYPSDEDALLAAIRTIKADGDGASARQALKHASRDTHSQGAAVQMVACTEFSLISDALPDEFRWIDTLDVLVSAILRVSKDEA